jgi:hypothetical protein
VVQLGVGGKPVEQEIPSASLRAGSPLRLKNGYTQDDTFVQKTKLHHYSEEPLSHGPRLVRVVVLRLQDLTGLRMNLLVVDLAGVPATAESFHQIDGADHLLAE